MTSYDLDRVVTSAKARDEFFAGYDKMIDLAISKGWTSCALEHAKKRERLASEVSLISRH